MYIRRKKTLYDRGNVNMRKRKKMMMNMRKEMGKTNGGRWEWIINGKEKPGPSTRQNDEPTAPLEPKLLSS